ncbi:Hypothetical protein NTJ_13482 [Nesidiocoris tenuis]|uniref:Uncharacterized protein n=1 Tax=Nesidiocoris tenuis TaxID=355587 RepID=A0ABN7BBU1_9HEMI|nr:Hypothetical protein NTJ_13482 [Nesidiocoris tenuis]
MCKNEPTGSVTVTLALDESKIESLVRKIEKQLEILRKELIVSCEEKRTRGIPFFCWYPAKDVHGMSTPKDDQSFLARDSRINVSGPQSDDKRCEYEWRRSGTGYFHQNVVPYPFGKVKMNFLVRISNLKNPLKCVGHGRDHLLVDPILFPRVSASLGTGSLGMVLNGSATKQKKK